MQAIITKVLGPTDTKPMRVKATTASGVSVTMSWDHELDALENANKAVWRLYEQKLNDGWRGRYVAAATADGYVFARTDNPVAMIGR